MDKTLRLYGFLVLVNVFGSKCFHFSLVGFPWLHFDAPEAIINKATEKKIRSFVQCTFRAIAFTIHNTYNNNKNPEKKKRKICNAWITTQLVAHCKHQRTMRFKDKWSVAVDDHFKLTDWALRKHQNAYSTRRQQFYLTAPQPGIPAPFYTHQIHEIILYNVHHSKCRYKVLYNARMSGNSSYIIKFSYFTVW